MTVQMLKLSECTTLAKGKPPSELPYFGDDAEPYLSPEYLRGKGVAEPAKPASNAVRVKDGDTILLWDGSNAGEVFRAHAGLLASTMTHIGHSDEFKPEYFCYAAKRWESYLKGQTSGSGIPHVDKEVLGKLEILKLPPDEQTLVANILNALDRAIEQTESLITKQQRIKTGLMQDLLSKGIDAHGNIRSEATHAFKDSPLGRIPVEWDVDLLDKLALRGSGHTPSKRRSEYWNGGIKWISLADSSSLDRIHISVTDKEISELGLKNSSAVLHPAGTVVLSRDAGVGKSAVMGCDMAVSQHFMAWRCGKRLHNYFLYYWLQRDKPRFEGIASGSTIVTIGLQFFRNYQISYPIDITEQVDIAKVLLDADEMLFRLESVLGKLMHIRSGLMHDLLTGKRRVTSLLAPLAAQ